MREINSKVSGVTFNGRQDNVKRMREGMKVFWEHQPDNPYDSNCIALYADFDMEIELGNLNKGMAEDFVLRMNAGRKQEIVVMGVTGGSGHKSYGLNIKIIVYDDDEDVN